MFLSFSFILLQQVFIGWLTRSDHFFMIETLLLFYIHTIDWFIPCLDLFVVSFHLNCCSWYDNGCLTRSDYFVWLWNNYYLISNLLIGLLLAKICMLFLSIQIFIASMLSSVLQEVISLYDCKMVNLWYSVHWLIL